MWEQECFINSHLKASTTGAEGIPPAAGAEKKEGIERGRAGSSLTTAPQGKTLLLGSIVGWREDLSAAGLPSSHYI